jgi:hypothetical protein
MKNLILTLCCCFFLLAWPAAAEDVDLRTLREKLAAQQELSDDLEARMNYSAANANFAGVPEGVLGVNKNASATVGGRLNTRYYFYDAKIDSIYANPDGAGQPAGSYIRRADITQADLRISHARVFVKANVSEHFDAFVQINLQSSSSASSDNAQTYWVRWKNIQNSGFGVLVGRESLIFGEDNAVGILGNYAECGDGAFTDGLWGTYAPQSGSRISQGVTGDFLPRHNYWDHARITQIAPYWEGLDGRLLVELSLFQNHNQLNGRRDNNSPKQIHLENHTYKNRNYGTSFSGRIGFEVMEGLKLSASLANFRDNAYQETLNPGEKQNGFSINNTALSLAASYRPAFADRLYFWGQWMRGWNVDHYKDVDSDSLSYGASFDLSKSWILFAAGDYLRSKDKYQGLGNTATAWAAYAGIRHVLPYGVTLETGFKHERVAWKERINQQRVTTLKGKGNTAYIHVGFRF